MGWFAAAWALLAVAPGPSEPEARNGFPSGNVLPIPDSNVTLVASPSAQFRLDESCSSNSAPGLEGSSPLTKHHAVGRGSARRGGTPASVGHKIAFGNTLEHLHRKILGTDARGSPADGPFDHSTRARATSPSATATTTTR